MSICDCPPVSSELIDERPEIWLSPGERPDASPDVCRDHLPQCKCGQRVRYASGGLCEDCFADNAERYTGKDQAADLTRGCLETVTNSPEGRVTINEQRKRNG